MPRKINMTRTAFWAFYFAAVFSGTMFALAASGCVPEEPCDDMGGSSDSGEEYIPGSTKFDVGFERDE